MKKTLTTLLSALLLFAPAFALAKEKARSAPVNKTDPEPAPLPEPSAGEPKRIFLAPKIGFFKTTTPLSGAFFVGLEAGYLTSLLDDKLALSLEVDFHGPGARGSISDPRIASGDGAYSLSQREIGVLAFATYRAEGALPVEGLTPYGGLGPAFLIHSSTAEAFGSSNTETGVTFGFGLVAGADYRLGPGAVFGELHYHFAPLGFRVTGDVNVGGFLAIGVGYRFRF